LTLWGKPRHGEEWIGDVEHTSCSTLSGILKSDSAVQATTTTKTKNKKGHVSLGTPEKQKQ
jgi:hypothetical protein